jgi:antitoxin (DNA-binding transcriptional repressor) of toxin-antitoxin stability system
VRETPLETLPPDALVVFDAAQSERVLITRDGKPFAIVVGLEHKDAEDADWESSPEFWRMIERRRQRPTVPLSEAERRLFGEPQA